MTARKRSVRKDTGSLSFDDVSSASTALTNVSDSHSRQPGVGSRRDSGKDTVESRRESIAELRRRSGSHPSSNLQRGISSPKSSSKFENASADQLSSVTDHSVLKQRQTGETQHRTEQWRIPIQQLEAKSTTNQQIDAKSTTNQQIDAKSTTNQQIDAKSTTNQQIDAKSRTNPQLDGKLTIDPQLARSGSPDDSFTTASMDFAVEFIDYEDEEESSGKTCKFVDGDLYRNRRRLSSESASASKPNESQVASHTDDRRFSNDAAAVTTVPQPAEQQICKESPRRYWNS